jgi:hypothetical protein
LPLSIKHETVDIRTPMIYANFAMENFVQLASHIGDLLLHDIGTGEGIVQTNGEVTREVRTLLSELERATGLEPATSSLGM